MTYDYLLYGNIPRAKFRALLLSIIVGGGVAAGVVCGQLYIVAWAMVFGAVSFPVMQRMNFRDLKNKYAKEYSLTEEERKDSKAIIKAVQFQKVESYLGDNVHEIEYLRSLIQSAKEHSEDVKRDFDFKKLGVAAIIAIILNNCFSVVFSNWKTQLTEDEIFERTLFLIGIFFVLYLLYYYFKSLLLSFANSAHERHKEIYFILKDLEITSQYYEKYRKV